MVYLFIQRAGAQRQCLDQQVDQSSLDGCIGLLLDCVEDVLEEIHECE